MMRGGKSGIIEICWHFANPAEPKAGGESGADQGAFPALLSAFCIQAGAQHLLGTAVAFAAAGADAEFIAQLQHATQAQLHGLPDFAVRHIVADTNDHGFPNKDESGRFRRSKSVYSDA